MQNKLKVEISRWINQRYIGEPKVEKTQKDWETLEKQVSKQGEAIDCVFKTKDYKFHLNS